MTGPTVSLGEAARTSHLSTSTLRRWLDADRLPGATRNAAGGWAIPVASLVESGAWSGTSPVEEPDQDDAATEVAAIVGYTRAELLDAVGRIDELAARTREAEKAADSERRLRESAERNADDLRTALRMLEAGPTRTTSTVEDTPEPIPQDDPEPTRQGDPDAPRGWLRRIADRESRLAENRPPPPWGRR
jgi:hypothetical protein